jgi:hypothetical protein
MTGEDRLCTPGRRCGVARGGRGQRGEVRRLTARRRRRRIPLAARPPPLTAATISLDFVRYASPLARATRCVESVIDSPPPLPETETRYGDDVASALADIGNPATVRILTRISLAIPTTLCEIPSWLVSSAVRSISAKPNGCARGRRYADHWT